MPRSPARRTSRFFAPATTIASRSNARGTSSNLQSRCWRSLIQPFCCAGKYLNHTPTAGWTASSDGLSYRKTLVALLSRRLGRRSASVAVSALAEPLHWLSALLARDLRQGRLALWKLLLGGRRQQTFPDGLLPSELARPANSLGFFARLSFRRLFV